MSGRPWYRRGIAALACAAALVILASDARPARGSLFVATNLVTDDPLVNPAILTDPNLRNAWGISATATGPFWVSANDTGLSTLYRVDPVTNIPTKVGLEVKIPGNGSVTGQVNNPVGAGAFNGDAFLFVSEDGTISGWRGTLGTNAEVLQTFDPNNVYLGTTAAEIGGHAYLYSANFHNGNIDILKGDSGAPSLTGNFTDPNLPAGYAPFGIQRLGNTIYVTYALQNATGRDDVPGAGHGIVNAFDLQGNLINRIGTGGTLNSPWGLAIAPSTFGEFAGDLLVGNSGDGRINVFDPITRSFLGQLNDLSGHAIAIDGLWGLMVGNGVTGSADKVYFAAGPNNEAHGLFGVIEAVPAVGAPEPSSWLLLLPGLAVILHNNHRRRESNQHANASE